MVLGLIAVAAIPTTIGVAEGVSAQGKENDSNTSPPNEAERMRKFNLECYCENSTGKAAQVHGGRVLLRDNKLYIDLPSLSSQGHPFEGFYISYPDPDRPHPLPLGLVSTINKEPPILNWIYLDRQTRQMKYGNRTQSREHIVGSWGWDAGEEGGAGGLTLEGGEGAVAVQTGEGWELRWENEEGKIRAKGSSCLMVSLERKFVGLTDEERRKQRLTEERVETKATFTPTTFKRRKRRHEKPHSVYRTTVDKETQKDGSQGSNSKAP